MLNYKTRLSDDLRPIPKPHLNSFNAIRLFAAAQVVYFHTYAALKLPPMPFHQYLAQLPGVPIFFALSGFLVINSAITSKSAKDYFLSRANRIYPALFVNIALIEILLWVFGNVDYSGSSILDVIWYQISYMITGSNVIALEFFKSGFGLRNWEGFFQYYPSGVLWTLTVELSFYAIAPLLVFLGRSRTRLSILVAAMGILSILYSSLISPKADNFINYLVSVSLIPYFWFFAIGIIFRMYMPSIRYAAILTLIASIALYTVAHSQKFIWFQWKYFPQPIAILQGLVLSILSLSLGLTTWLKSRFLLSYDLSYGIYLYHMLVVTSFASAGITTQQWLLIPVFLLSLVLGLISWIFIEKPFIFRGRKEYNNNSKTK